MSSIGAKRIRSKLRRLSPNRSKHTVCLPIASIADVEQGRDGELRAPNDHVEGRETDLLASGCRRGGHGE